MPLRPVGGRRPLVVGIGGTGRPGSTTERALELALASAEGDGAEVHLLGGAFLSALPLYLPQHVHRDGNARELLSLVARADGVVVASPSYHGGVSALVKNALDYLEDLREDCRPYLDGRAVGCVVTSAGWQAGGATLAALRSIVHALRGWPTPLGVTLNTTERPLDGDRPVAQLHLVGRQVVQFAAAFSSPVGVAT
nr:NAD(P)H-dependent oxidoreductase [Actinophytocola oryzae]